MVKEAEKFAAEDTKRKEEAELLNQANTMVYTTEKALKDYGDKVTPADKEAAEKELGVLKASITEKNHDHIKSAMESLQKVSHKLAEEAYKATAAQANSGAGANPQESAEHGPTGTEGQNEGEHAEGGKKDDVIDADFKASSDK